MPGMLPPQYGSMPSMPYPNPNYAMPGYAGQPVAGNWNPAPPRASAPPQMPVMASLATGGPKPAAPVRPPIIRLQAPETLLAKPAVPLALPSPETLGIGVSNPVPAPAAALDWNNVHARLQRLGAPRFST